MTTIGDMKYAVKDIPNDTDIFVEIKCADGYIRERVKISQVVCVLPRNEKESFQIILVTNQ